MPLVLKEWTEKGAGEWWKDGVCFVCGNNGRHFFTSLKEFTLRAQLNLMREKFTSEIAYYEGWKKSLWRTFMIFSEMLIKRRIIFKEEKSRELKKKSFYKSLRVFPLMRALERFFFGKSIKFWILICLICIFFPLF